MSPARSCAGLFFAISSASTFISTAETLQCDLELEGLGHPGLKDAIEYCESGCAFVTRELLEDILASEEDHIDWLETQLGLVEKLGAQNYLRSQV